MNWKKTGTYQNIHEVIDAKSGGRADEFINTDQTVYRIQNAEKMASKLMYYARKDEPITIVGDYDVDGVHATAELYLALTEAGAGHIRFRLPKRMSEGFGLKETIIDEIPSGVLVTVDNGIAAIPAIKKAKEKGLTVLVIDHHMPVIENNAAVIPPADLIVDPNADDVLPGEGSVFHSYCAAGLVYRIAGLMIPGSATLAKISALAAIATVADVMPLIRDNRNIYKEGLKNICLGHMTGGLKAIIDQLQTGGCITERDIGFRIAPMINAPGRVYDDGATRAFYSVIAEEEKSAFAAAQELKMINEERKQMKTEAQERADKIIAETYRAPANPIIIADPETAEGIVGLVAGYIQEKYNASAIVFTSKGDTYKGSARAEEGDNLKKSLDRVRDIDPSVFVAYGGHKGAAGVTIRKDKLDRFRELMEQVMDPPKPAKTEIPFDLEISPSEIKGCLDELQKYVPFGEGNPKVVFKINGFKTVPKGGSFYQELGDDSVRFSGAGCDAIAFSMLDKYNAEGRPKEMDIIGTLGYYYIRGKAYPEIEIADLRKSDSQPVKKTALNMNIASILAQNNFL